MSNGISRKTWDRIDDEGVKLDMLFDLSLDTNDRVKRLEMRKRFDTVISGMGGVIGGAIIILLKWLRWG